MSSNKIEQFATGCMAAVVAAWETLATRAETSGASAERVIILAFLHLADSSIANATESAPVDLSALKEAHKIRLTAEKLAIGEPFTAAARNGCSSDSMPRKRSKDNDNETRNEFLARIGPDVFSGAKVSKRDTDMFHYIRRVVRLEETAARLTIFYRALLNGSVECQAAIKAYREGAGSHATIKALKLALNDTATASGPKVPTSAEVTRFVDRFAGDRSMLKILLSAVTDALVTAPVPTTDTDTEAEVK